MNNPQTADVNYDPLTGIPLTNGIRVYVLCKRIFDIAGSGAALILLSPLLLLVALAIKLEDGGNIFYISSRVGVGGRRFKFIKFRSMVMNADQLKERIESMNQHDDHRTFKLKQDPRTTLTGRIIRRLSIDELPQLWNVLFGDMSIVGPRPTIPNEVDQYATSDLYRFDVLPGLTCIWQVSGRGDIPFEQQVQMDLDYIQQRSMWFDLKLVFKTIPAVLSGKGAY
ncbi:UDP-N-acetylgalactosamine-undecaprenyl-phosphate N-acetylgalactosaminephosphotransferase [Planctomycetes bacterium CA13]|uniref:UDP-N-acetylgalactosamine-undecaprenyl-phosphate N-acetylgalactosaminephosphotransferase n=1 Tax=Novipirellula herctigrandis TaxID=2527986 RepID=A0A5C5Z538_9BACT|nr:UDP-N-acetylgalactosamine-undecaprenyl-phosphate N-acetylgalactosaminephosphotransferase [Planctomycetes bacterium CA13]